MSATRSPSVRILGAAAALLGLMTLPAAAASGQQHLLGDWGGWRSKLGSMGIDVGLSYLGEIAWDAAGGKKTGASYADQEELSIDLDGGKLAGLPGFSVHAAFVARHGRDASALYVGDSVFHAQEIYGSDPVTGRLAYFYAEEKAFGGRLDVKAGRLPVLTDFGTVPHGCEFMALAICAERGLDTNTAWTPFPFASWGGSVTFDATKNVALKTGIFEANARRGGHYGYDWSTSGASGVMTPVELDWTPTIAGLPGTYKVGGFVEMGDFPQWYRAVDGLPQPLTSAKARSSNRTGAYFLAEQKVWSPSSGSDRGLSLLGGYVWNSPKTAFLQQFGFLGLLDRGPVAGRPDDVAGFAVDYARVSPELTSVQDLQSGLGLALSHGAPGVETHEVVLEANYKVAVAPGVTVMPDIQYVIRPSAAPTYRNALVLGIQGSINF